MPTSTPPGFNIKIIVQSLSPTQRKYLLFSLSFSGCDTVSAVFGFSKEKLYGKFSNAGLDDILDVLYDENSTVDEITSAGISTFQFIYNGVLERHCLNSDSTDSINNQKLGYYDQRVSLQLMELQLNIHCLPAASWLDQIANYVTGPNNVWLVYHEQWEVWTNSNVG